MRITSSSNTSITAVTPKVIETGNGFLINTQYYTKERLSAVALEFLRAAGSPYALSIKKQLFLQPQVSTSLSWRPTHDEVEIFKDSTYENRFYVRVIGGFVESNSITTYLLTIEESYDKEFKCLNIASFDGASIRKIVDQDDNFVYITTLSSGTVSIHTLNKTTFAILNRWSLSVSTRNYFEMNKLYSDSNNIYFMYFNDQSIYTSIYNKSTHVNTISPGIYRGKETASVLNMMTVFSDNIYEIDDNTSGLFFFNTADPVQPIDLYYYDRSKSLADGFDMQPVNIVWNDNKAKFEFEAKNILNTLRIFISEFDNIKYLNVVSYRSNFAGTDYIPYQGIYTFRIDSKEQLTFTGFTQVDATKLFSGVMYDESKEHLIIAKLNAFQILKFNKNTFVYENTGIENPSCYSVGLDELQRIWYIKTDSSTHLMNLEDAQSVNIRFEKQYYDFSGSSIDTYITFSALNYMGEPFSGKFELTINGPAVFTDGGSTVVSFDYEGEMKQIGLTILGASPITIYPKFIKSI